MPPIVPPLEGQTEAQPAYVIGPGMPESVWHGRVRQYPIHAGLRLNAYAEGRGPDEDAENMIDEDRPEKTASHQPG